MPNYTLHYTTPRGASRTVPIITRDARIVIGIAADTLRHIAARFGVSPLDIDWHISRHV
jgi:hypothetical protein